MSSVAGKTLADFPELAAEINGNMHPNLDPSSIPAGGRVKLHWKCSKGPDHEWKANIWLRIFRKSGCPYCAGRKVSITNSLQTINPKLASEWHPTKNRDLTPNKILAGSGKKVWWKCNKDNDHEWDAVCKARLGYKKRKGSGCPYCARRKVSVTNRLDLHFPKLAKEWHPTKNGNLSPSDVTFGTAKKVWWKCSKGPDHEWQTVVSSRTGHYAKRKPTGCPYCDGKKLSVTNRLDLLYPEIAKEWHPTLNGELLPSQVKAGSHTTKAWWLCGKCGNEWKTPVIGRTWRNNGCRKCGNFRGGAQRSKPTPGKSLGDLHPELLEQLHPTRNEEFDAYQVRPGSGKKVWWVCQTCSHEWRTAVSDRTQGHGCKMCGYIQASKTWSTPKKGQSLLEKFPLVARDWHPSKNGKNTPKDVRFGSKIQYWWKCDKGPDHEWEAAVAGRTGGGEGCPFCSSHRASVTNSLQSKNPELAKLWHPNKNQDLQPKDITEKSSQKVWWKCPQGPDHEWESSPSTIFSNNIRSRSGNGCPCCSNHKLSVTNCLQNINPEVSAEWNTEKNKKRPDEVIAGGHTKFWWKCHNGHEWPATISKRMRGRDCPQCQLKGVSKIEVRIGFELYNIFNLEYIYKPKIKIDNTTWLPDIAIEELKLVIEYDGAAFHGTEVYGSERKVEADKRKTEELTKEGWTVIRIREKPLQKLTNNDIIVNPRRKDYKKIVNEILTKAIELGKKIPNYENYIQSDRPLAKRAADEYIAKLQKEAEQETLEMR